MTNLSLLIHHNHNKFLGNTKIKKNENTKSIDRLTLYQISLHHPPQKLTKIISNIDHMTKTRNNDCQNHPINNIKRANMIHNQTKTLINKYSLRIFTEGRIAKI